MVPAPVSVEDRRGQWGKPPANLEEFFWWRVDKTDTCWLWLGKKTTRGYGQAKFQGTVTLAHRYSWELLRGPIPEGYFIDHLCHVPGCVNPDHLRIATHSQNMQNLKGAHSNSRSGVRNVHWDSSRKAWRVRVAAFGTLHEIGHFDSLDEAEIEAEAARLRLHH